MKILVINIAAEHGGALTVLNDFYQHVRKSPEAKLHQWKFVVSISSLEPERHISTEVVSKGRFPWFSRLFCDNSKIRKIAGDFKPDIILSLQNTHVEGMGKIFQAVYIHQSIPFQKEKKFSFFKRSEFIYAIYQYIIGIFISRAVKQAAKVFVQTNWMKRAIGEKTGCNLSKITVVPMNHKIIKTSIANIKWNNKLFFYPAFNAIYKNQDIIYKAAEILEGRGIKEISITLTTQTEKQNSLVKEIGRIQPEEVMLWLQKSTLIFPSYIETVGLPLIEAMETGTMILAADCEYAHETLGDYVNAYYFNPFAPEELADLMERISQGELIKRTEKLKRQAENSSWHSLIKELIKG